ncbi:MAG TPA: FkbM family methyltransferase [Leptolyngbyaceae cyanobacterium M33_DOE_097]|uniref:FkbM family methyltransferase n=1 Tax=Oscillatoriales cyanobacterium SpSt-418 TaxID=2282169 RepID=A0A7C3PEJ0_9CYAN|nr:FkbM family methyltransferase [Leptolyngbyaceae cyanobacterium M33_DOE_097]
MTRSRRILIINNLYPPQVLGGYERSIADFARILNHQGHSVLVLTTDNPEFETEHLSQRYPDPTVERCLTLCGQWKRGGSSSWFDDETVEQITHQNLATLAQRLQTFQPEICLVGNIDFLGPAIVHLLLESGVPVVHYVMNKAPGYALEVAPHHPSHRYVTCSDWVTKTLLEAGYPAETAATIYPGAVVEEFYRETLPPRDRLRIAYASIVMPYKGIDVLVEALSLLNAMGIDFSATIAGDTLQPEFVETLKAFIASEGFGDRVSFVGGLSRQQLSEMFQTHNVLAFPSRFQEPFGISQIEAMAAGLALVTSGTGGAAEIVESGVDGIIFESENPLSLAESLFYLSANPTEWEAIARKGQQKAITQFTQHRAVEQLLEVFEQMMTEQHREKTYQIGAFALTLPLDHKLDVYQANWKRYDTALGYISQAIFEKYPDHTAIDIGANVGDTAALIRTYNKEVPLLCVEGNPEFITYLESNTQQLGNVQIATCFIGEDNQAVDLNQISSQSGTASVVNATQAQSSKTIPMQSLTKLLQEHPQFQTAKLLKIDTDGYDFTIIQTSLPILASHQPVLFFEYDPFITPTGVSDSLKTVEALITVGYERFIVYDNFGNYLLSLSATDRDRFCDLNAYLKSSRYKSGKVIIYYFDICAFSQQDVDLFEQIRQKELSD